MRAKAKSGRDIERELVQSLIRANAKSRRGIRSHRLIQPGRELLEELQDIVRPSHFGRRTRGHTQPRHMDLHCRLIQLRLRDAGGIDFLAILIDGLEHKPASITLKVVLAWHHARGVVQQPMATMRRARSSSTTNRRSHKANDRQRDYNLT